MKIKRAILGAGAIALVSLAVGYWAGRARAAIPTSNVLTYSGVLTDNAGTPINGARNIQLQIWDQGTDGTVKCTVGPNPMNLIGGAFDVSLPAACITAVQASGDLWVEAIVNGESLGRSKLGAVPYALEAAHATRATTADTATTATTSTPPMMIRVTDNRAGCPGPGAAGVDLISLPLTLTVTRAVQFSGDMIRSVAGRADLGLFIDGVLSSHALTFTPTVQWAPAHVEWVGTLPAGTHTAGLRATDGQANIWGCTAEWGALSAVVYQ